MDNINITSAQYIINLNGNKNKMMSKPTATSVKAELDTLAAISQERFLELLSRVKRIEAIMVGSAGTTIILLLGIIVNG